METTAPGDANAYARRAVEERASRVIVAGGDGTVNEVINAIANTGVELALVPRGTGNVLARELSIPLDDVDAACDIIAAGHTVEVDLGKANGRYFTLMAGLGFDAAVVDSVRPRVKDILGQASFGVAYMKTLLRHKPSHFNLTMDGEEYETVASLVVVANASSYAPRMKVAPGASYSDGLLDICVFESARSQKMMLLSEALRLMLSGTHSGEPHIRCFRAANVTVDADPPVLAQIDGDVIGQTPVEIEVAPVALKVVTPG